MINNVTLVGRLTRDPELRYTPNGVAVSNFTLAVNRTFTNQNGEREADFPLVVTYRKTAENVANYLHKGSLAGVTGRIQTRSYEGADGKTVYVTEVVADSVQFLEPRGDNGSRGTNTSENHSNVHTGQNSTINDQSPMKPWDKTVDVQDDDLPF